MPGWLRSASSGPLMWMLSNVTSTASINQHQRKGRPRQGEESDRSRALRTGSAQRGAGTQGRRELGARCRQATTPRAGKSLAGAHRPGASQRMGALRRRWKPGEGGKHGETHHGGSADVFPKPQSPGPTLPRCWSTTGAITRCAGSWSRSPAARTSRCGPTSIAATSRWVLPGGTSASMFWITFSAEPLSAASLAPRRCSSAAGSD